MFTLITLIAAVLLILRKSVVQLRIRFLWLSIALAAYMVPSLVIAIIDALAPQWPFRAILIPFSAVAELIAPWIVFAMFNERTSSPAETESTT